MKKFVSILLAVMLIFALAVTAMASTVEPTTGTITVKNATKGYTYNAYKVFDATYSGTKVSYKTASANATYLSADVFEWSSADANGNISVWVKDGVSESTVLDWVKANYSKFGGTAIAGAFDDENSTVTFSGLPFGYYYITSGLGAAVTIDSAIPSATVYDKNVTEPVNPVKTIVSVDGVSQNEVTEANAHVGSVVGFKITAKTNNWVDKDTIRTSWGITDTTTYMFIDPESIVVKVNGNEITNFTAAGDGNGGMSLNIPMVDDKMNSIYPANLDTTPGLIPIEITYSAIILQDAGKNPAKNQIPGGGTKVYTYGFQVAKTDGTDPLPGAQFELWSNKGVSNADAAALTFIDNGDGTYTYYAKTSDTDTTSVVTTLDMTTNTTISILGLDNKWAYTLKEITVPDGYNQVADIDVAGSSLTKVTDGMDTSMTSTALYKETVVNKAGAELPSTGGIGTTIFYIVGGLLIVAAGVLLITKKRMSRES